MKFCFCFYGVIGRSIEKTYNSIKTNFFDVLKEEGIEFDIYLHNNEVNQITSNQYHHSNEKKCVINNSSWKILKPKKWISEYQNNSPTKEEKMINEWKPDYPPCSIALFALYEMYSCYKVSQLCQNNIEYDCYIYLRPDLEYINKLDIEYIKKQMVSPDWNKILLSPTWDTCGCHENTQGGLNDRIAIGGKLSTRLWGERFLYTDEFFKNQSVPAPIWRNNKFLKKHFVAEVFTYWVLVDKNKCIIKPLKGKNNSPFGAIRVRASGFPHAFDLIRWKYPKLINNLYWSPSLIEKRRRTMKFTPEEENNEIINYLKKI